MNPAIEAAQKILDLQAAQKLIRALDSHLAEKVAH